MAQATANADRSALRFRPPRMADGPALWSLARASDLDENSPYAYLLWTEYFADTTVVATHGGDADDPVGFVTAFARPDQPSTVFVWQIGVAPAFRGQGIASDLLDHLATASGLTHLEATVTPSNVASETLFRRFAERHGVAVTTSPLFPESMFPPGHEGEILFRIGPVADA